MKNPILLFLFLPKNNPGIFQILCDILTKEVKRGLSFSS